MDGEWLVAARLDTTPLMADGTSLEGQINASVEGQGTATVPLKVERLPMSPLVTSLTWTIGVVVPAGLTYWLARMNDERKERRAREAERAAALLKQEEEFIVWRQQPESVAIIEELLRQQLRTHITEQSPHAGAELFDWMLHRGIFVKMPPHRLETLREICENENHQGLLDHLRVLFPEWQQDLIPKLWN